MTNLSPNYKKNKLITPENSLFFIPVFIGIIILVSLLNFAYRPLIRKLDNENSQIEILNQKISLIPIYKNLITKLSISTNNAKKQQERLIDIISDPEELNTILSEIDRISHNNEIKIITIEPKPIIKFTRSNINLGGQSAEKDPFLLPTIEKHIFNIILKGEFKNLLRFLREIELLQTIAIADNINIKSNSDTMIKGKVDLTMSFSLTTYARILKNKAQIFSTE